MKFLTHFKCLPVSTDQLYRHIEIDKFADASMSLNNLFKDRFRPIAAFQFQFTFTCQATTQAASASATVPA